MGGEIGVERARMGPVPALNRAEISDFTYLVYQSCVKSKSVVDIHFAEGSSSKRKKCCATGFGITVPGVLGFARIAAFSQDWRREYK